MTEVEKTKKSSKEPIVAKDALGQDIYVDAIVVAPVGVAHLQVGRVIKISPKTLKFVKVGSTSKYGTQKPHAEVVVISELPAATMYMIQHS